MGRAQRQCASHSTTTQTHTKQHIGAHLTYLTHPDQRPLCPAVILFVLEKAVLLFLLPLPLPCVDYCRACSAHDSIPASLHIHAESLLIDSIKHFILQGSFYKFGRDEERRDRAKTSSLSVIHLLQALIDHCKQTPPFLSPSPLSPPVPQSAGSRGAQRHFKLQMKLNAERVKECLQQSGISPTLLSFCIFFSFWLMRIGMKLNNPSHDLNSPYL